MRDQEILGLHEAYLEVYEEVDKRRAPKEMIDRLNASREGHMAQDGPNKPAYDAKQRLLKKAHEKRTQVSEAQEEGRRARKRSKNAPSYDEVKKAIDEREKAAAERRAARAAARRTLTPAQRYEQEKAARTDKSGSFSQYRMTGSRGHGSEYQNTRSIREEILSYLFDEGFASDEKSAEAIMDAMSEAWIGSIVEEVLDERNRGEQGMSDREVTRRRNLGGNTRSRVSSSSLGDHGPQGAIQKFHNVKSKQRQAIHKTARGVRGDTGESGGKGRYEANKDHADGYPSITKRGQGPS